MDINSKLSNSKIRTFNVKWISNDDYINSTENNIGELLVETLQFPDGVILGKIDNLPLFVAGRYVDRIGCEMYILDTSKNSLPIKITVANEKDGNPNQLFGSIQFIDFINRDNPEAYSGLTAVKTATPSTFKRDTKLDFYIATSELANKTINSVGPNSFIYHDIITADQDQYANYLKNYYNRVNEDALTDELKTIEAISFE